MRGVLEPLRGLVLALGVDDLRPPLALGLGLARHRPLHAARDLDVLDLDDRDLDSPRARSAPSMISWRIELIFSRSDSSSSSMCWPSTARSVVCAICDVATMKFSICTIASFGVDDPEVRDRVHAHRHVVLGDDLLRRDVERDRAQVDPHHPVDDRNQEEEAGPLRLGQQPAEPEDDAPLVLARDLDRRDQEQDEEEEDDCEDDEAGGHGFRLLHALGHRTVSSSPSTDSTSTCSPGTSSRPSSRCACHSSPST